MINKKKWFSPLFVVFLAVAGIFSISSYVSDKQVEEVPVVEKAEAATNAPPTLWFKENGNWLFSGASLGIWIWPDGGQGHFYKAKYDSVTANYYFPVYDRTCYKAKFIRVASGDTTEDGSTTYPSSWKALEVDLSTTTNWYNLSTYDTLNTNNPAYCGYYVVGGGSFGGWKRVDANYLVGSANDIGSVTGFSVAADATDLKVLWVEGRGDSLDWSKPSYNYYNLDNSHNYPTSVLSEGSNNNISLKKAATYDFCFTTSHTISIVKHLTITLNPTDGSVTPTSWPITITYTGASTNKYAPNDDLPTPQRDGFTGKWYTSATGGTEVKSNTSTESVETNGTIYAQWTANEYTIKYNQNDGTSHYETETKTGGEDYTIASLADLGMGASGGRYFVKWSTDEHGESGDDYDPGDTYETNADLELFMIQSWYHYQYSNDGGNNWIEMTRHDGEGDYHGVFYPDATHILTSGNAIIFRRYVSDPATATTYESITHWYGNYDTDHVVYTYDGQVTLKIKADGTHDVWVDGYSQRSIVVTHGGNTSRYHLTETTSQSWDLYTTLLVTLYPGDTISAGFQPDAGAWVNYNPGWFEAGSDGDFTIDSTQTNPVYCNAPGVFTIHLVSTYHDTNYNNVKFVMDNSGSAKLYAQTFNSDISSLCTGITGGTKTFEQLKAKMGTSPSTANTEYRYYNSLTSGAKALIVANSSDTDIANCVTKYNYILSKYHYGGSGQLVDFMGKNPPQSAIRSFSPFTIMGTDDGTNFTSIIIIVASSISLLSITALSVLVIKKRKTKEK